MKRLAAPVLAFVLIFFPVLPAALPAGAGTVHAQDPVVQPLPEPSEGGPDGSAGEQDAGNFVQTIVQKVLNIHRIILPWRTVVDALNRTMADTIKGRMNASWKASARVQALLAAAANNLFPADDLNETGRVMLPVAAGLGVPLFLLRLAMYHWRRLAGERDTVTAVVQDWVVAGAWAFAAPVLTTAVLSLGVSAASAVFGQTLGATVNELVAQVRSPLAPATNFFTKLVAYGFIGALLKFAAGLGVVAGIVAMAWAFVTANALAFMLAAVGPVAGIAGVIPHMRWLRSLWLKAVVLLGLFPIALGALFRAMALVGLGLFTGDGGPMDAVIRVIWLWGVVGMMFSLAGIAGRFTIGAGMEVGRGMIRVGTAIVSGVGAVAVGGSAATATAAAAGPGSLSTPSASAPALASGSAPAASAPASATAPADHLAQASAHLAQANRLQGTAGVLGALGLGRAAAAFSLAGDRHALAARQAELSARMKDWLDRQQIAGGEKPSPLTAGIAAQLAGEAGETLPRAVAEGVALGVRRAGGDPSSVGLAWRQAAADMAAVGENPDEHLRRRPVEMGRLIAAYQQGASAASTPRERLLRAVETLTDGGDAFNRLYYRAVADGRGADEGTGTNAALEALQADVQAVGLSPTAVENLRQASPEAFEGLLRAYPAGAEMAPRERLRTALDQLDDPTVWDLFDPYLRDGGLDTPDTTDTTRA